MKFGKKSAIVAGILISGYAIYEVHAFIYGTGPSCSEITYEQATNKISKDFLEDRMPRWTRDSAKLGTRKPTLQFDRENTQVTDAYFVPFTAIGTAANIEYFAIYDCKLGMVEYSVK